jgi:hypothetical protein
MEKIRLTVEELPELDTEVAISGSAKQEEVGSYPCLFLLGGVVIAMTS